MVHLKSEKRIMRRTKKANCSQWDILIGGNMAYIEFKNVVKEYAVGENRIRF